MADGAPLEEVLVTARKRAESISDVPDAITAIGEQRIEQAGLESLRDFTNLVPNITLATGAGVAYPNIMVRGLAQAQGGEAPIAVVIDGVQLAHPSFINQYYGNVERVEVLRGPQGSLYGRNAIGGAINITTRTPGNELAGRVKLSYGNADTATASAYASGPIVADRVFFGLSGSYNRTDGQIRSITTGELADHGRNEFISGRLLFDLTEALTLDVRGSYAHDDVGVPSAEVVSRANFDEYDPGFLATNPLQDETRTIHDVSAKLEYQGSYVNVTSITGYMEMDDRILGDVDHLAAPLVLGDVQLSSKAFTQELRLTSAADGSFRWLLGAFYQDRDTHNFLDVQIDDGTGHPVPGAYAVRSNDLGTSESWAAFGSASVDITPRLEATLGARYDEDERTSVDGFFPSSDISHTFTAFQPKVQLAYELTEHINVFGTYGEGFSSGGFNAFFSGPANRLYEAQQAENYELGIKGSAVDGRLSFAANVFRVFYDNQQFFYVLVDPPSQNITNIDQTRVDGVEIELTASLFDGLEVWASYGLTDGEIRKFSADPASVGNRPPQNTAYTFDLAGQYTVAVSNALDLSAYASFRQQGSMYWDAANTLRTEPKEFVDVRLSLESESWSVGAFGKNLTNSQYPGNASVDAVFPDGNLRIPSPRRTYGVEAAFRF